MHHYRFQNVYITATASERIVDTLDVFPHNSPMPQMSSTDRLLMAAQDMNDDLKQTHPDVPFVTMGDETISALATLADIFTRKFKKTVASETPLAPVKAEENKQPEALVQPTLESPLKRQYKTILQTQVIPTAPANVIEPQISPQPPRVATPATGNVAPPRVPTGARRISPRNMSQDFLDMGSANCAIAFGENHWTHTNDEFSHSNSNRKVNSLQGSHERPRTRAIVRDMFGR
jgi:hypothetical protein